MKVIEFVQAPASVNHGNLYLPTSYPSAGGYIFEDLVLIVAGGCVFTVLHGKDLLVDYVKSEPGVVLGEPSVGVTAADLLKAIAISQKPDLAKDLI